MLMHSTLEEAWPNHHQSRDRIKSKECDLFDSRTAKVKKPYKPKLRGKKKEKMKNMMLFDEEDYENGMLKSELEKYHGYEDSREFSRTKKHSTPKRKKKVVVKPEHNTYEDVDSDSDDEYDGDDVIREEVDESMSPRDYIFEEVYEEDEDNYLSEKFKQQHQHQHQQQKRGSALGKGNAMSTVVEEELEGERRDYLPLAGAIPTKSLRNVNDMNQLLDLSIYTLSGIMLIFILEQFVQLGVKLKSFN